MSLPPESFDYLRDAPTSPTIRRETKPKPRRRLFSTLMPGDRIGLAVLVLVALIVLSVARGLLW